MISEGSFDVLIVQAVLNTGLARKALQNSTNSLVEARAIPRSQEVELQMLLVPVHPKVNLLQKRTSPQSLLDVLGDTILATAHPSIVDANAVLLQDLLEVEERNQLELVQKVFE